jgi:selenocysteine insertion sequence-binding protein 2
VESKLTKVGPKTVAYSIFSLPSQNGGHGQNLDQYGVINKKLQGIIDIAKTEDVPLFFGFTKQSLGKAIRKNIKIAVVGIQSAIKETKCYCC